jgi:hypothetical protein
MTPTPSRPTPETDAKASPHIGFYSCATVPANFARALERERDEAREENEAMREAIRVAHDSLKAIDNLHNDDFPSGGDFSDTAIDALNKGNVALIKLQPFLP